jgi:hypothetical protein
MANPYDYFDALSRYNQGMNNMMRSNQPSFGAGLIGSAMGTMNNLGSNIGNAFAQANAFSSANMANQVPYNVEMARQQGANQRLKAVAPLLAALFGGGSGGGLKGITTNYGAGVSYGQGQKMLPNGKPDPAGDMYPGVNPNYAGTRPANVPSLGRQPLRRY